MPKIYRTMLPDESGTKPKIGCEGGPGLGVRIALRPGDRSDVTPDQFGNVSPGKGMSVAPSIGVLDNFRIPKRLNHRYPRATGSNKHFVWSMGEGAFVHGPVAPLLHLRVTSATHGQVEPSAKMKLDEFQQALESTQNDWRKDEE